jgi:hypothetical protein
MENINELIKKLRIDPLVDTSEQPSFCKINNISTLTAGSFSLITGKKKAGKTFLLGGILASVLNNSTQIGIVKGCVPDDKTKILYFDTEQSPHQAARSVKRICTLVGNPNPDNLLAFCLRTLTPKERLDFIEAVITMTPDIAIVAIDGIRDLLTMGINDEQEATKVTNMFMNWSTELNIHIILLLHQNKNDLNPRGHIGTEITNKAETIISVTKVGKSNAFRVVCEDSRDVSFDDFGFTISEEGLPIYTKLLDTKQKSTTNPHCVDDTKHVEALNIMYKNDAQYNYSQLRSSISEHMGVGITANRDFVNYYVEKEWLKKEPVGRNVYYRLNSSMLPFYRN